MMPAANADGMVPVGGSTGGSGSGRSVLTANTRYYVAATGSDSNPGTITQPWLTLQHAMDYTASALDIAGKTITWDVGAGSFAGFGAKPTVGGGNIFIKGAGTASTTITGGPNDGVFNVGECASWYALGTGTTWWMGGLEFDGSLISTTGANVFVGNYNLLNFADPTDLSTPVDIASIANSGVGHFQSDVLGQFQDYSANITISGDALFAISALAGSTQLIDGQYTLSGAQAYGYAFFWGSLNSGCVFVPTIVSGTATGYKFILQSGAEVTAGVAFSGIPGDKAGVCDVSSAYNGTNDPNFSVQAPTTGSTINMVSQHGLVLNPAGTLATLTINLPPSPTTLPTPDNTSSPWEVTISTTKAITALTIGETDGSTIIGAPSTLAANSGFSMVYDAGSNTWYPVTEPSAGAALNTQVRVTFQASSDQALATNHCSIGIQSTNYNTTATPVELTFGGGNHGFSILAGASITSDWVNLPFTTYIGDVYSTTLGQGGNDDGNQTYTFRHAIECNGGVTVVVDMDVSAGGPYGLPKSKFPGLQWYGNTTNTAYYNQANPTGAWNENTGVRECISLIETR